MERPQIGNRQFQEWRAVEVMRPRYGSAYRIGGRLVLTAAHLVDGLDSDCSIRSKQNANQSFGEVTARVVWKAQEEDIALVELPEGIEPCKAAVLGRPPTQPRGMSEFEMYAYPKWAQTEWAQGVHAAGGRYIRGIVYWADTSPDGLLVLEAQRSPAEIYSTSGSASEWQGASGAAIVCDGLVIAVQRQHQNPKRRESLEATLFWRGEFSEPPDEQWCALLREHGISTKLQNVRLKADESARVSYFFSSPDLGSSSKLKYLYDPASLNTLGPARLFPYSGEDGSLKSLSKDWFKQVNLSEPWTLLLHEIEQKHQSLDQAWSQFATLLVDFKIFQSGWFNTNLPPNEQFDRGFVRERRGLTATLLAAKTAAKIHADTTARRSQFYQVLEDLGRSRPVVSKIHGREGGLSDREFARQRLAGQNPMALRQVQHADQTLLQTWSEQADIPIPLIQAAAEKRLFVADYPLLNNLTPADLQLGRYVGSPIAVFYQAEAGLETVLIQVEKGRLFTPTGTDVDRWMQAKLFVQTADVTYHELISHLCDTHLAMEAFAIATPRQLPATHPLYRLLRPHFRFLLSINTRSNTILLDEGAAIDNLMAPTRAASMSIINQAYRKRPFQEYALPTNISHRGVEPDVLPEFPYRDDALLLWEAIARYVTQYLQRYYPDDQSVQQDLYLQAWAAELGEPLVDRPDSEFPQAPPWLPEFLVAGTSLQRTERPSVPRVPGFLAKLSSLQPLIDIATQIIFTCGPQHAAVNFSQFDYVGYVPNAPLALYGRPGSTTSYQQLLPMADQDLGQMELTFALSGIRWGSLGSSGLIKFVDAGDLMALTQFQADLAAIEVNINTRNQQRLAEGGVEYPYLLPSRIPNSINI